MLLMVKLLSNLLPEFQINVNNDQGVKLRKGEMVERSKKVKVVGVLKEIVQPNALTFLISKEGSWKSVSPLPLLAPQRHLLQILPHP